MAKSKLEIETKIQGLKKQLSRAKKNRKYYYTGMSNHNPYDAEIKLINARIRELKWCIG